MSDQALYSSIGVLVVLSGAALVVLGYLLHRRVAKELNADDYASSRWLRAITASAVTGSLLLSTLIIVTT